MQLTRLAKLASAVLGIAACTSSITTIPESGGFPGAGPAAGTAQASTPPPCPTAPPREGSRCDPTTDFTTCRFGADTRDECLDTFDCLGGSWTRSLSAFACRSICPETFAAIIPGAACSDDLAACSYEEGTCACVSEAVGADAGVDAGDPDSGDPDAAAGSDSGGEATSGAGVWKCVPPPHEEGCPDVRPPTGQQCVRPVVCDYGSCAFARNLAYSCVSGSWQPGVAPECEP